MAVLDANGGNVAQTARDFEHLSLSESTIRNWRNGHGVIPPKLVDEKRDELSDVFERLARKATGVIEGTLDALDGTVDRAMLATLWTGAGISVDKMRIMREQSTARITIDDLRKAVEAEGFEWGDVIAEAEAIVDACDR